MITQIVVAAALVNTQEQVLVQRRRKAAQHGGLWEFPGGKVEQGEALADALVRELSEELGIIIKASDLAPIGFSETSTGTGRLLLLLYRCDIWDGDEQSLGAEEIAWVDMVHLGTLVMPPADVPLIDAVRLSIGS